MKRTHSSRKPPRKTFEARYGTSVREYIAHGGEARLKQAYELGREAIATGRSLTEIASLHHAALRALLMKQTAVDARAQLLQGAAAFLIEILSPYEMAQRGFQDSVKALRELNETLEEEIKRIAYAVHDEAGQLLVAGHLELSQLSRDLPEPQQEKLEQIGQLLDQVQEQLRKYSHELRPAILDDLGCVPALRFLIDSVSNRSGMPIEIDANVVGRLPSAVEIALYRVVQEGLANATKHANAKHVFIRLRRARGKLCCTVRDDGAGFDVRVAQTNPKRSGLGLLAMKERLHAVGGTFSIDSAPGRGTTLRFDVPAT